MDKFSQISKFKEKIRQSADKFNSLKATTQKPIKIVSHLDCDGISSASIIIRAMENENLPYTLSIIQQLSNEVIKDLENEDFDIIFFTDLGSGSIKDLSSKMKDRQIFILDHHEIEDKSEFENISHVNPHLFDIDGGTEISGAGTVFLFAKELNKKNEDMAHIAIVGAIGDVQEKNGFSLLNDEILQIAKEKKLIDAKKDLRLFGQTKFLHKMLEYSNEPYIPNVSGNESGAIQLLCDAQIDLVDKKGNYKRFIDLNDDEKKRLAAQIILRRISQGEEENPEDVFGMSYTLINEKYDNLRDAREFSTLLNATGRMKNASLGIGVCLGKEDMKKKAITNLANYKREIVSALKWFEENKNKKQKNIFHGENFVIINAKENIIPTIAGTLASIIAKSNNYADGTMILSMAKSEDGIKTSLRIAGRCEHNMDLRDILNEIVQLTGGETGGHKNAAGAIIPHSKEDEFINHAKKILDDKSTLFKVCKHKI